MPDHSRRLRMRLGGSPPPRLSAATSRRPSAASRSFGAVPAPATLPLADLLLTKMQVVELNHKDMVDTAAVLQDHPFTQDDAGINIAYITDLTRNVWGLQRTLEKTVEKLSTEEHLRDLRTTEPR